MSLSLVANPCTIHPDLTIACSLRSLGHQMPFLAATKEYIRRLTGIRAGRTM